MLAWSVGFVSVTYRDASAPVSSAMPYLLSASLSVPASPAHRSRVNSIIPVRTRRAGASDEIAPGVHLASVSTKGDGSFP